MLPAQANRTYQIFVACGFDHGATNRSHQKCGPEYYLHSCCQHVPSPHRHAFRRRRASLSFSLFSISDPLSVKTQLTVGQYIRKSLIASFIGNAVGALFVALPAVYFYLWEFDYVRDVASVRGVEEGEGLNELPKANVTMTEVARNGGSGNTSLKRAD